MPETLSTKPRQIPSTKHQILNNFKIQNTNDQNSGILRFEFRAFEFGICLRFGYWDLEFRIDIRI
jgi:hypothetical protein